jgi:pilus assembly protein CpaF
MDRIKKEGSDFGATRGETTASARKFQVRRAAHQADMADQYQALREEIHESIIEEIDPQLLDADQDQSLVRAKIEEIALGKLQEQSKPLPRQVEQQILKDLEDEILGYGPIQSLLDDETIDEVMVNGPNQIYVEQSGKLMITSKAFKDNNHVMRVIEKIVSPLGRRIDESSPYVDARLPDGSRVHAIIPPLALCGPTITIRKFSKDPFTIHDLVNFGTMTEEMAQFLQSCVEARLNIIVSGGTGSGKTTTLNVLSSFIPDGERIVTVEDAAELQIKQTHWVSLESRPPNIEGRGQVTIRDLVKCCLRMRPDRIVVGECRSGEALDMLQAMNTGHDGSLTTAHANSPRDCLSRLETMVMMAGMDLPVRAIREQISSAVDLIVQQSRMRDGSRKITSIAEVVGMEGETITLQDIFRFEQKGLDETGKVQGRFKSTGIVPKFIDRFTECGVEFSLETLFLTGDTL